MCFDKKFSLKLTDDMGKNRAYPTKKDTIKLSKRELLSNSNVKVM